MSGLWRPESIAANEYVGANPNLYEVYTDRQVLILFKMLMDAEYNGGSSITTEDERAVRVLLKFWDWSDLPEILRGNAKMHIFDCMLKHLHMTQRVETTDKYILDNLEEIQQQHRKYGDDFFMLPYNCPEGVSVTLLLRRLRVYNRRKTREDVTCLRETAERIYTEVLAETTNA